MSISDIIQIGILLVAVVAILCSHLNERKQRKLQLFSEYTRRYQDIFLNMPDDIYSGEVPINDRTKRYLRLYFDLCSEEYHLWQDGVIPSKVWDLWIDGMRIAVNHTIYKKSWISLRDEYNEDFKSFFETDIINYKMS